MRKIIAAVLSAALMLALGLSAFAAPIDYDEILKNVVEFDVYYGLSAETVATFVEEQLYDYVKGAVEDFAEQPTDAKTVEDCMNEYFEISADFLAEIRNVERYSYDDKTAATKTVSFYDAKSGKYNLFYAGGKGGAEPKTRYLGYLQKDNVFTVYLESITRESLEETDEITAAIEAQGTPDEFVWEGKTYRNGVSGYAFEQYGAPYLIYRVNYLNGHLRYLSVDEISKEQLPTFYQHSVAGSVVTQLPSTVTAEAEGAFFEDVTLSVVSVSEGKVFDAAKKTFTAGADKYLLYEVSALAANGFPVEPTNPFTVTVSLPEDFTESTKVYLFSEKGALEPMPSIFDPSRNTVTVTVSSLCTFAVCDAENEPVMHSSTEAGQSIVSHMDTETWTIVGVAGGIALALLAFVILFTVLRKEKR